MMKTFKTECFPTEDQKKIIEINFGLRRFYFNTSIVYFRKKYGKDLKQFAREITKKEIMLLRKELFRAKYHDKVKLGPSVILDSAMEDVQFAINSLKKKGKVIELRKKAYSNTCRYYRKTDTVFKYQNNSKYISLVRMKNLKMAEPIRWNDPDIRTLTIKKQANRYFVSISCEIPDKPKNINQNRHLGMDWGIKTYFTGYDGKNILEVDFDKDILKKLDKRLKKCNQSLFRKIKGSKNYAKAIIKRQKAYLDFVNYRRDFIYQVVKELDNMYDSVTLENLNMRFVTSNKNLSKAAHTKPYYLFKITLINKFLETGKNVYLVPKTYPSTQTCNKCGYIKTGDNKMKLGEHTYICPICGNKEDRDVNAAMNIYSYRNLEMATIEEE